MTALAVTYSTALFSIGSAVDKARKKKESNEKRNLLVWLDIL